MSTFIHWQYRFAILLVAVVYTTPLLANYCDDKHVIHYSKQANSIVLEYDVTHSLIATEKKHPLLRVYGDGRVVVHYPSYMKQAGDYESFLNPEQMQNLLTSMANNCFFNFNPKEVLKERSQALQAKSSESIGSNTPTLFYVSDSSTTQVTLAVQSISEAVNSGSTLVHSSNEKATQHMDVAWKNLKIDAQQFGGINKIQGMASIDNDLRQLMKQTVMSSKSSTE